MFNTIQQNQMNSWFKNNNHPQKQNIYAITTGTYVGEMIVLVKEDDEHFYFLSIPKNINRQIPKDKVDFGFKNGIIDFVEKIPKPVNEIIIAQFNKNENSDNRRQQSDS
jgi:hypothetical protein